MKIPRYKFGTYEGQNELYDWFIMDTKDNKVVENIVDKKIHEVRAICSKWNEEFIKESISKFHTCWNCVNFKIEKLEDKYSQTNYECIKHKDDCNIKHPKLQACDDFKSSI